MWNAEGGFLAKETQQAQSVGWIGTFLLSVPQIDQASSAETIEANARNDRLCPVSRANV